MTTARNSVYKTADEIITNTQLASLAVDGITALGAELDLTGSSDRDLAADVDIDLGSFDVSTQPSPGIELFAVVANAAGTYSAHKNELSEYAVILPVNIGSGAEAKTEYGIRTLVLQPAKYKFYAKNATGVQLAATGNSIKVRRRNIDIA